LFDGGKIGEVEVATFHLFGERDTVFRDVTDHWICREKTVLLNFRPFRELAFSMVPSMRNGKDGLPSTSFAPPNRARCWWENLVWWRLLPHLDTEDRWSRMRLWCQSRPRRRRSRQYRCPCAKFGGFRVRGRWRSRRKKRDFPSRGRDR